MRLAVIQFTPVFGSKEQNIQKISKYINEIEADIIIFPELSVSGYFFQSRDEVYSVAENFNGKTIESFQELSIKHNKTLVIGFPERDGEHLYNSAAILLPNPDMSKCYRKTHLFYKERFCFDKGNSGFFVIEDKTNNIKIGTMICYDWRFPEAARTLALLGADLIVCPSNLVTKVWNSVMHTRALENMVYLAVANRTGKESRNGEELYFNGNSIIYDYLGNVLASAGNDEERILLSEIEPEKTRNKSIDSLNNIIIDRRPECYSEISKI